MLKISALLHRQVHDWCDSCVRHFGAPYPEETSGSRLAAKTRKLAAKLTPEEEAEHFRRGMAMIYGSQSKETSGLKESARAGASGPRFVSY